MEQELREAGFAFVAGAEMARVLDAHGMAGWDAFARQWDDLGLDTYMADGGRYRKRRHGAYAVSAAGPAVTIERKPHQPHYQSRDYNALNGGVARWFTPVEDSPALHAVLRTCHDLFDRLTPMPAWHVEAHQFRIEARPGTDGKPTPEGMHRDGVDWVLVLMVNRHNIAEGATTVHGLDHTLLGAFTLRAPMDAALVDDNRVFHGVTPVRAENPAQPAHRDVLVVTFRRA